jgi:hypothetical protein
MEKLKSFLSKFLTSKRAMTILSLIGLYLLSTGTSWAIFSYVKKEPALESEGDLLARINELPKTEECPINGAMYTQLERDIWEGRRPITAIIENHQDARPQSGLSKGDVVYEAVAEGGITRFLSVFYCGVSAKEIKIAPIRSARVYYVNWAAEYGESPLFVHIGGANNICNNCPGGVKTGGTVAREVDAFTALEKLGWRYSYGNDFDGGTNIGYPVIIRDQYRLGEKSAWEHSVVGFSDKIFEEGDSRGFAFEDSEGKAWDEDYVKWLFKDDNPSDNPNAKEISFEFWSNKPEYNVFWKYDDSSNKYLRENGGEVHVDLETDEQIYAKNVVIMMVSERGPVDKEGHMFYTTIDEGTALIFQNGGVIDGTWEKASQTGRTKFYGGDGKEVTFVRGPIWIEAVPDGNEIKY